MDDFKDLEDSEIDALQEEEAELITLLKTQKERLDTALDLLGSESPDEVRVKARKWALANLQAALNTIGELNISAEKDATRLSAARTIWTIASTTSARDDIDPIGDLFKKISD